MKHKQEEVIKEKAKYDKLKVAIEEKQRKLKKVHLKPLSSTISRLSWPSEANPKSIYPPIIPKNTNNTSRRKRKLSIITLLPVKC